MGNDKARIIITAIRRKILTAKYFKYLFQYTLESKFQEFARTLVVYVVFGGGGTRALSTANAFICSDLEAPN